MAPLLHKAVVALQLCLGFVAGQPTVAFPFNAQLPPVARTGSLFTYAFSPHTFSSDLNLTYELGDHPSWLSFEADERRLYGIPRDADIPAGEVVGQTLQIIATDDDGSVTMDATVVVSRDPGPSIKMPIADQIKDFGDYSAPASILSYPSTSFTYTFDTDTFQHDPDMINYYATSGNSSPLPAWIRFDAPTLTFSGSTPGADALFQPPQTFDIRLVASDIEGFSSTAVDFSIVVAAHKLATDNPVIELNASRGSSLEYDQLASDIKLDDQPVEPADINVTATNLPDWISFDTETWEITGTPGSDDHSTNFTLSFIDSYSDTLDVIAVVNVATKLFETTFQDVEAIPGEKFSLDLAPNFKDPSDIDVNVITKPDQEWLKLDGFMLEGKVPEDASGEAEISVQARSKSSDLQETETLTMTFAAPDGSTTMTPTTHTPTPSETSRETGTGNPSTDDDDDDDDDDNDDDGGIGTTAILLATIIPVLFVALLVIILACFIRRRRNRRSYLSHNLRPKISHPIMGTLRVNGSSDDPEMLGAAKGGKVSQVFYSEKGGYAHAVTRRSSHSSDTMGTLSRNVSEAYMFNAGHADSREIGTSGSDERAASWLTEERTMTAGQSDGSAGPRSRGSDVTMPHSTHQLLPTPPLLPQNDETGFRDRLDLTIPMLDEIPGLGLTPHASYQPRGRSEAMYSSITTSSAALPLGRHESLRGNPVPYTRAMSVDSGQKKSEKSISDKDWSTIREDEPEEPVPDLPPPGMALLSSNQLLSRRSAADRDSFLSETSFGSTENWRVIGRAEQSVPNLGYKELVEESPFYPQAGGTPPRDSTMGGPRDSAAAAAATTAEASARASQAEPWREPPLHTRASRSRFSRLNEDEVSPSSSMSDNWRREGSGDVSEGSFKAFL